MRITLASTILAGLLWALTASPLRADTQLGLAVGDDGVKSFYLAVGDYYRAPEKEVVVVRERSVPDDELPVVFFLARRASVSPQVIVDMRLGGKSYMDISLHYGLSPEIFYIPVAVDPGPPYGKAYGYYKNKPRKQWKEIRLGDSDIVNLVNLRFLSEHYSCAPDKVIRLKSQGKDFVDIQKTIKNEKSSSEKAAKSKGGHKSDNKKSHKKGQGNHQK